MELHSVIGNCDQAHVHTSPLRMILIMKRDILDRSSHNLMVLNTVQNHSNICTLSAREYLFVAQTCL